MPERIDLDAVDDPRDVVHRAVASLAQGGVVALAADSGYVALAPALDSSALDRLTRWLDPAGDPANVSSRTATLLLKTADELRDWVDLGSHTSERLTRRAWPGSVIFRLPPDDQGLFARLPGGVRDLLLHDARIAVQAPLDRFLREVLRLTPGPIIQLGGWKPGDLPGATLPLTRDDWERCDQVAILIDSGPIVARLLPTEVSLDRTGWTISRPGVVPESQLERWAGVIIMFVCTGNTCRSPMAEALCKAVIARRIGCDLINLASHGYFVTSAGVATSDGMPAATNATEVVRVRGGSLQDHESRQLTSELIRHADHILAMTWDHLDAVIDQAPEAGHRVRLLDPAGGDIPDPVGLDLDVYQATAREIERHLEHLLEELGI